MCFADLVGRVSVMSGYGIGIDSMSNARWYVDGMGLSGMVDRVRVAHK